MSNPNNTHFYHLLRNKELNRFCISVATISFGEALISIFVPIYFYQLGYPMHKILLFYFLASASFVALSFPCAKIVSTVGTKHAILLSTAFLIAYYIGLRTIEQQTYLFYVLPALMSVNMILYNLGYHIHYFTHSHRRERGRDLSFIGMISLVMNMMAPLIGGIIITYAGFSTLYIIGATIVLVSTIPLLLTRDKHERVSFTPQDLLAGIISKRERNQAISFAGYAIESIIGRVVWPVFIITVLATTYKMGVIIMLSSALSLAAFYVIGELTDRYDKKKLLDVTTTLYFLAWMGRIFATTPLRILVVDSYKNMTEKFIQIPWAAKGYELADKQGYFRFILSREIVYNLSRVVAMPIMMAIFLLTPQPYVITFMIAAISSIGYVFLGRC